MVKRFESSLEQPKFATFCTVGGSFGQACVPTSPTWSISSLSWQVLESCAAAVLGIQVAFFVWYVLTSSLGVVDGWLGASFQILQVALDSWTWNPILVHPNQPPRARGCKPHQPSASLGECLALHGRCECWQLAKNVAVWPVEWVNVVTSRVPRCSVERHFDRFTDFAKRVFLAHLYLGPLGAPALDAPVKLMWPRPVARYPHDRRQLQSWSCRRLKAYSCA